jgi:hypothetical protein
MTVILSKKFPCRCIAVGRMVPKKVFRPTFGGQQVRWKVFIRVSIAVQWHPIASVLLERSCGSTNNLSIGIGEIKQAMLLQLVVSQVL